MAAPQEIRQLKAPSDPLRVRAWFEVYEYEGSHYWMRHTQNRYPNVKLVRVLLDHEDDGIYFVKVPGKAKLVSSQDLKEYAFILATDDKQPEFPQDKLDEIRKWNVKYAKYCREIAAKRKLEVGAEAYENETRRGKHLLLKEESDIRKRLEIKLKVEASTGIKLKACAGRTLQEIESTLETSEGYKRKARSGKAA
ncbi:hypothetical protein [Pseudomonas amygdali]|uniref:Uncharacterized protein n=1 Tax=Pseudomonas amygdali pv. lachrymans str. M301315 TaxID=629260 RepID=A0AAD0PW01_PSEAV|nr:hypothetical protein [Pseudomonas amygdali]AXH59763.1 hypothetical protein PLA107_031565 [Pseudomonas amygdali pv. lachrymans str. M301315]RMT05792.1 hypothetical protein ALP54_03663 [Pseudomonas amygdali pv. lachrymans]